ncbi:MAG: hypothetical protein NTNFB01_30580 [Nitrospira sp.]
MDSKSQTVKIRFEDVTVAEGGQRAEELRNELLDIGAVSNNDVEIAKDDPRTQDFGATLVMLLGAPAAVVLARGIRNYLERRGGSITVESDGKVVAKGVHGSDVARIVEAIFKKK